MTATGHWDLRLYVAGHTEKSVRAINNLKRICREHLEGRYTIEVIDLIARPQLAAGDQIIALPTLVRRLPELDYALFDRPGSTARYDDSTMTLQWDMAELDRTRTELNAFLVQYYAAKKGRK